MVTASAPWPQLLEQLFAGQVLSKEDASALMEAWLVEELTPVQTGAFLAALRGRTIQGSELSAMAQVLRKACALPGPRPDLPLVDTCGTGGDGANTFNISTAVAFTAAACGANVAKHGNRSASGKVGSADVLEGLGLQLNSPMETVVAALASSGVTFLFAPAWHPALVNLAPLRRSLGVRTIFNLLGPLVNPLTPEAQVLGVANAELLDPMAEALQELELNRAVVVHGSGGLDEASLQGPNQLRILENGFVRSDQLHPSDFGLTPAPLKALRGGDLVTNQQMLEAVLKGEAPHAHHDVVVLNTALVLWAAGVQSDLAVGVKMASTSLHEGEPWHRLVSLRQALGVARKNEGDLARPSLLLMTATHPFTARLVLHDGTVLEGFACGQRGSVIGEVVFNTGMTGYQEVLTDPSYAGQLITFTYPEIGNTGVNPDDQEADQPHARGLIVRQLAPQPSNWRSQQSLPKWMEENDVIGIQGVDTRALVRHLRALGPMNGVISSDGRSALELLEELNQAPSMEGLNLADQVSTRTPYVWSEPCRVSFDQRLQKRPDRPYRVVVLDFGIKRAILNRLVGHGCELIVLPANTTINTVLSHEPEGVFLSNGPGDPAAVKSGIRLARALLEQRHLPMFGMSWSSNPGTCPRRQNLQTGLRPSRSESSMWQQWTRGNHESEPRICSRRSLITCGSSCSDPSQSE